MDFELDHLFVCVCEGGDVEADGLMRLGLAEGQPNSHPGQGTACRRFFFANAYLELLWVHNPTEAQAEMARPLRLWERWSGRASGACPFGVCLRPARPGLTELPFCAWEYRPAYLPAPLCLHVATGSPSPEGPLLFYLPVCRRPDARSAPQRQPLGHALGVQEISQVRIFGPRRPALREAAAVAFEAAEEHLAEVVFDGGRAGGRADLRPLLPLVLCW
jgi:hypothetical protein